MKTAWVMATGQWQWPGLQWSAATGAGVSSAGASWQWATVGVAAASATDTGAAGVSMAAWTAAR